MAAGPYDAPANLTLADFQSTEEFSQRGAQPGVTAELTVRRRTGAGGHRERQLFGHEQRSDADSGLDDDGQAIRAAHQPQRSSGPGGLDSRRRPGRDPQLPTAQPRTPGGQSRRSLCAHRFHRLAVCGTDRAGRSRWSDYQWPYGNLYAIYRESIQHTQISSLGLWYTNLPQGKKVTCYLSPIKALPLVATKLINPSVRVGDAQLTFPVEIDSGCYLEFQSGRLPALRAARGTAADRRTHRVRPATCTGRKLA